MPINVSEAIDSDTGVIATLIDRVGGGSVDGIYVAGPETTRKAVISFQQPTPRQLEFLKDGERQSDLKAMYINKAVVQTTDGETAPGAGDAIEATEVIHRGNLYKIVFAGDWNDYGFMFAIGARIERNTDPFPNSMWRANGMFNCNGTIYCSQNIIC